MPLKSKILSREHSWRLRPHEHTSYLSLAFLLLITGLILTSVSFTTSAEEGHGPFGGSVALSGTMPAKPPTTGATITEPVGQQHFSNSPITVAGTCPAGTIVEVFKNKIFAGSTPCDSSGHFKLKIDPLYGKNTLTAIVYDALNQAGPTSNAVPVFYDASLPQPAPANLVNFPGTQLVLSTDAIYRGTFAGQILNVPISVIGGTPPFAVNVQWGDGDNKVIPRSNNAVFNASHAYKKGGIYEITMQGSDSKGLVAFLQVAAIITGQPAAAAGTGNNSPTQSSYGKLLVLWPAFAIAVTMVVSFWYGEKREKRILTAAYQAQNALSAMTPQTHA